MKVKVVKIYLDKYTRNLHRPNEIQEISKERFLELTEGPRGIFVEEIKEKKKSTKKVGD